MQMIPVSSKHLHYIGYDFQAQILRLKLNAGCYDYSHVPPHVHAGLLKAESKANFILMYINGVYPYTEVD